MSRKPPSDTFTRFTSNTPSFASSSSPSSSTFTSSQPPTPQQQQQPQETAQQRVSRLRAAHAAKRAAELNKSDRILARGRTIADILHRGTTYTLLGFSALATVVAAYGFVSLVSHNRRQKRAWIEREMDRLEGARAAFLQGQATPEQLHLLEQERAGEEISKRHEEDKRRRKEEGWFNSVKSMFRGAAGAGEMGSESGELTLKERGERLKASEGDFLEQQQNQTQTQRVQMGDTTVEFRPAVVAESAVPGVGLDREGRPVPLSKMERVPAQERESPILDALQSQTQTQNQTRRPGQLDVLADNISSSGSSWLGSLLGRGSKS